MLMPARPTCPWLGKKPYALFDWLVLRTAPSFCIMVAQQLINKLLHSFNPEFTLKIREKLIQNSR